AGVEAHPATDGTFALEGLTPGELVLGTMSGTRVATRRVELTAAGLDAVVLAAPSGSGAIRGLARNLSAGAVELQTVGAAAGADRLIIDAEVEGGVFHFADLPSGRYRIEVYERDRNRRGHAEVTVDDGEVAVTVDVQAAKR
ncbi:MAG: hypothetical protein KDC98_24180, partial [Planctomycetes bacterium]|nr:hypothetical protein [Planctomycetota bacterium]